MSNQEKLAPKCIKSKYELELEEEIRFLTARIKSLEFDIAQLSAV